MVSRDKRHQLVVAGGVAVIGVLGFLIIVLFGDVSLRSPQKKVNTQKLGGDGYWNDTARYAFISDKKQPQLAVFDTYGREVITTIALKIQPEYFTISRLGEFILYARTGGKQLYRLDLRTGKQEVVPIEYPIIGGLVVDFMGDYIAYTSNNKVVLMKLSLGKSTIIDTKGKVKFLYAPAQRSLFFAELNQGRVRRVNLDSGKQEVLFSLGKAISPISIMPNMMALFFSSDGLLYRYSLLDETLNPYGLLASSYRPYVTSESRTLLALDDDDNNKPQLLAINAYTEALKYRYPLDKLAMIDDKIVTGWLEQVAIIATTKGFKSIDLLNHKIKDIFLSGEILNMLVQPDSKVLLATQKASSKLLLFSLQKQQVIGYIDTGLEQPYRVMMGQTTTLCH